MARGSGVDEVAEELLNSVLATPKRRRRLLGKTFWGRFGIERRTRERVEAVRESLRQRGLALHLDDAEFGTEGKNEWIVLSHDRSSAQPRATRAERGEARAARPRLYLNHDADYDWLTVLEFGEIDDGHPQERWRPLSDAFAYFLDASGEEEKGFEIRGFSAFDPEGSEVGEIWSGPRFDVPVLGLEGATAGEIVVAAILFLEGRSTINRHYFGLATRAQGVDAAYLWKHCLQAGDLMAHFGLGYTLWEIGRYEEAHKHLETYTRLTPHNSWAWSWLGKACEALDDTDGARSAYERAIELEEEGADETDASELLSNLQRAGSPNEPVGPPPPAVGEQQASPTMKFVGDAPELREGVELVLAMRVAVAILSLVLMLLVGLQSCAVSFGAALSTDDNLAGGGPWASSWPSCS